MTLALWHSGAMAVDLDAMDYSSTPVLISSKMTLGARHGCICYAVPAWSCNDWQALALAARRK
jgi:hypothetical protein